MLKSPVLAGAKDLELTEKGEGAEDDGKEPVRVKRKTLDQSQKIKQSSY